MSNDPPRRPAEQAEALHVSWGCASCGVQESARTNEDDWEKRVRAFLTRHEQCLTTVTMPGLE